MISTSWFYLVLLCTLICVGCVMDKREGPNPVYDVAITNMLIPSDCNQGDTVPIAVSIANKGVNKESFQVILTDQTNGFEIASREVTVSNELKDESGYAADMIFDAEGTGQHVFGFYLLGGDVNADGYDDLICSAAGYNNSQGRVYIYYGGENFDNKADLMLIGDGTERLSQATDLGDFNGDGYLDIAAAAMFYKTDRGRVYIYYGGPEIDETADIIVENPGPSGSIFGRVLDTGDVNNDGYDDLIINANLYDEGTGRAYLYYGGNPFDTKPDKFFDGEKPGDRLGRDIAVGDVDGDGCEDILFGTRDYDSKDKENVGRAYLYYGAPGMSMDTQCDVTFTGEEAKDELGSGVHIQDIDGDGCGEIIIGSRYWNNFQGRVSIYWGGKGVRYPKNADVYLYGERFGSYGSNLGEEGLVCGYFNDDKYPDVFTGGTGDAKTQGHAYIFYGNEKSSMDNIVDKTFCENADNAPNTDQLYGGLLCAVDLNKDGFDDAVISDIMYHNWQGRVYLYWGSFEDTSDVILNWDTTNASIGKHILKIEIPPVPGEQNTEDNVKTITIDVKDRQK